MIAILLPPAMGRTNVEDKTNHEYCDLKIQPAKNGLSENIGSKVIALFPPSDGVP